MSGLAAERLRQFSEWATIYEIIRFMHITSSYKDANVMPGEVRDKYEFLESGSAAAVIQAVSPNEWADIVSVLQSFELNPQTWLKAGGNRGDVAKELDGLFEERGWAERRLDIETTGYLLGKNNKIVHTFQPLYQEGYLVDNFKGRVAVDIEWNAKDGNLDRDMTAYRTWYEAGVLSGAVIITKELQQLRDLMEQLLNDWKSQADDAEKLTKPPIDLRTTTTTTFEKAALRLRRGVNGTCPLLIVGVGRNAWNGQKYLGPMVS